MEIKNNSIRDMSTRGFLIEILEQAEVISGFLFTFISHKL